MSAAQAKVVRDAARRSIPATELVPGDITLVEEDDTVPADARLIESGRCKRPRQPLTGESLPVARRIAPIPKEANIGDRSNMIFSGTSATYGHGHGVVTATGMHTQMGGSPAS
jgi:Ca2+-transporting ATPase